MLPVLAEEKARVICTWPGATTSHISEWGSQGITVSPHPVDLHSLLTQCRLVVNYGSSSLVCQSLLAGKPQLMMPSDTEKMLIARRVSQLKAGAVIDSRWPTPAIRREVQAALRSVSEEEVLRAITQQYRGIRHRLAQQIQQLAMTVPVGEFPQWGA